MSLKRVGHVKAKTSSKHLQASFFFLALSFSLWVVYHVAPPISNKHIIKSSM